MANSNNAVTMRAFLEHLPFVLCFQKQKAELYVKSASASSGSPSAKYHTFGLSQVNELHL